LALPHFAYLRAWVEGVSREEAARRYLGLEHGHALVTLHRQIVDGLRAIARRRGDSRWRLVGIDIGVKSGIHENMNSTIAPLDAWAEQNGLADFSYDEQLEAWQAAFPVDASAERKRRRNARLRERQLEVLAELEKVAATPVSPADAVAAWLEPSFAGKLQVAGFGTLGELARAIRRGDRWFAGVKGVGIGKARRIEQHMAHLLQAGIHESMNSGKVERLSPSTASLNSSTSTLVTATLTQPVSTRLDGSAGMNRAPRRPTIEAINDRQAIDAWLRATAARSPATQSAYRKEAERWLLWCLLEREKALSSANIDDCLEYMRFLQRIPEEWQSRRKAARLGPGWTPFRGQLGLESRRYAVKVLFRMCAWLVDQARYLDSNPWGAVDRRLVDGDELPAPPEAKALSRSTFDTLTTSLPNPAKPGESRNGFLLHFGRYTGLRAAEMLGATLGAFERTALGWRVYVVGKGRKPRYVTVPTPAVAVLTQYLEARGLPGLGECPAGAPLLGSLREPLVCPTYSAVHQSFTAFVQRGLRASDLPLEERLKTHTQHSLRHTFATWSAEAGVPPDVLQAECGHADPATTAGYYKAQERRRQEAMERAAAA
jgi:integrase